MSLIKNYADDVPTEARTNLLALQYSQEWNMPMGEILEMEYEYFYELTVLNRALKLRRPKYEGHEGEWHYAMKIHKQRLG